MCLSRVTVSGGLLGLPVVHQINTIAPLDDKLAGRLECGNCGSFFFSSVHIKPVFLSRNDFFWCINIDSFENKICEWGGILEFYFALFWCEASSLCDFLARP